MALERYIGTRYDISAGPRELSLEAEEEVEAANCQLATQLYFRDVHGYILSPDQALSSNVYDFTGIPVAEEKIERFTNSEPLRTTLQPGHILCALDKKRIPTRPLPVQLEVDEDLKRRLHLAVVVGKRSSEVMRAHFPMFRETIPATSDDLFVFHACWKKGKQIGLWPLQGLQQYYWIIRIKDLQAELTQQELATD